MNATTLARKLDTALFLSGYRMRVSWRADIRAYELNFGYNSDYPHVYAYTSLYYPQTRKYCTTILPTPDYPNGQYVYDVYPGDLRKYVFVNATTYARIEGGNSALNVERAWKKLEGGIK